MASPSQAKRAKRSGIVKGKVSASSRLPASIEG